MTEKEIRDGSPDGATHYIKFLNQVDYLKLEDNWFYFYSEYSDGSIDWQKMAVQLYKEDGHLIKKL